MAILIPKGETAELEGPVIGLKISSEKASRTAFLAYIMAATGSELGDELLDFLQEWREGDGKELTWEEVKGKYFEQVEYN